MVVSLSDMSTLIVNGGGRPSCMCSQGLHRCEFPPGSPALLYLSYKYSRRLYAGCSHPGRTGGSTGKTVEGDWPAEELLCARSTDGASGRDRGHLHGALSARTPGEALDARRAG